MKGNFLSFSFMYVVSCFNKLVRHKNRWFLKKRVFWWIVIDTKSRIKCYWKFVTIFQDCKKMRFFETNPTIYNIIGFNEIPLIHEPKTYFHDFSEISKKGTHLYEFFWASNASNPKKCNDLFCWKYDAKHFFAEVFFDNNTYSRRYRPKTDFGGL